MSESERPTAVYAIIRNSTNFTEMFESLIHGEPEFQDFNCLDAADLSRLAWLYNYRCAINNDHIDGELLTSTVQLVENLIEIDNGGYVEIADVELWSLDRAQDEVFDLFDLHPDRRLHAYQLKRHMFDQGRHGGVILPVSLQPGDFSQARLVRTSLSEIPVKA